MVNLKIVPYQRQRSWGWPAVVNLTLGGAGAAFYLIGSLLSNLGHKWLDQVQFISYSFWVD